MFPSRSRMLIVLLLAVVLTTAPLSAFQPLSGHHGVQKGASWWIWLVGVLQKNGVSLDPDGLEAGVSFDPNGVLNGVSLDPNGAKNGVSLDPNGATSPRPAGCSLDDPDGCASSTQSEAGVSLDPDGQKGH